MQNLWRKLMLEWPCKLGDWLWANIAVPLSTLSSQVTFRRVVFAAAFLVAAIGLAQLVTADMAIYMAGETAFYWEIFSVVMLIAVRGHVGQIVQMTKMAFRRGRRRAVFWHRRGIGTRRRRGTRKPPSGHAESDDGEGYPVFAMQAV
jgi:hypothetical protein